MSKTPEEIQADIELQRDQLAQTVDQLTHKLDVKAQTKVEVLAAAVAIVVGVALVIWLRRRR